MIDSSVTPGPVLSPSGVTGTIDAEVTSAGRRRAGLRRRRARDRAVRGASGEQHRPQHRERDRTRPGPADRRYRRTRSHRLTLPARAGRPRVAAVDRALAAGRLAAGPARRRLFQPCGTYGTGFGG